MAHRERTERKAEKDRFAGVPTDAEAVKRALAEVMTAPTVDVMVAATVIGIGRNVAYREAAAGRIPSIRVGNQLRVPTAKLREMLGIASSMPIAAEATTSQAAA